VIAGLLYLAMANKLTDQQVIEIYEAYRDGVANMPALAKKYNVTIMPIRSLIKGKTYRHLNLAPLPTEQERRLTDEEAVALYEKYRDGTASIRELADEYNISFAPVQKLLRGKTYRHLNLEPVIREKPEPKAKPLKAPKPVKVKEVKEPKPPKPKREPKPAKIKPHKPVMPEIKELTKEEARMIRYLHRYENYTMEQLAVSFYQKITTIKKILKE
jgi:Mor family transcriptional regulator